MSATVAPTFRVVRLMAGVGSVLRCGAFAQRREFRLEEAEGEGFEPSIRLTTDNGFRDRRIRPLCHPSGDAVGTV
jgi:hypothetical protein